MNNEEVKLEGEVQAEPAPAPAPKPEITPEQKAAFERAAILSDMMVSARQDIQGIDGNLRRLDIHNIYWQRRVVQSDGKVLEKAKESLGNLQKQMEDLNALKLETLEFIKFLDEQLSTDPTVVAV